MPGKIYALLVGINDYAPEVGKLLGCLNDVDHFHHYLTGNFDKNKLNIEILKDSEATRDNIIKQFRTHLSRAGKGDIAVFQYCGHGARWASAGAFREFYPDGKDEGLVCYDSRRENGTYPFDLADKELAVLLAELANNDPHVAVLLDCCHSGSGTRDVDDFRNLKTRQTHEVNQERPLDSYIDGFYAKLQKKGQPLHIPASKHILLAACERKQKAWETREHSGVFTSTMLDVLDKTGSDITYADLFVRCRAAVRKYADNQDPQFEALERFNGYSGFLGRDVSQRGRRANVSFEGGKWWVNLGALHGIPTEPDKPAELRLYRKDQHDKPVGDARTVQVGAQKSELQFAGDPKAGEYEAEILSLPAPPLPVYLAGDKAGTAALQKALDPSIPAIFTDTPEGTRYALSAEGGKFLLRQRDLDILIQGVEGQSETAAKKILEVLKQVVQWEKSLALQNHATKLDTAAVEAVFAETLDGGKEHLYPESDITLDYVKSGNDWKDIRGKIKVRNQTEQTLHFTLIYFSSAYGIYILRNDPVDPGNQYVTLWGDDPNDYLYLDEGINESIENFKLIVSTERVDDFLLSQEDLELGKILSTTRGLATIKPRKKLAHENEWFTKALRIKVVRQLDQVGSRDVSMAKQAITVKAHPAVKANLSLSAAKSPSRSAGAVELPYQFLESRGLMMHNFAGTRGDNESVLELTDIQNSEALKENPLQIELNMPLKEDEFIFPLTFDGKHIVLGGDVSKDEEGNTHISIDHIPEVPDQRRSVGKALKLYFFKTYLKQENVNQLCWVEYQEDGSVIRHKSGVANKVAEARNVLLLIHGIFGDTEDTARGLRMTKDDKGGSIDQKFDLVLSYDYENLSTPISSTAAQLKQQLETVGFSETGDKRLTILAHSMGGLVSRWLIEQLGGDRMVDHLVMCGTPNNGSPFGKLESARKLITIMSTVALNYLPALAPASGVVMFLLNRSKKITPTLEQMNPKSEFIETLNGSADPGIPYTILAGDVEEYREPSDEFFPQLVNKAGKGFLLGALFGNKAHDIAVSVESTLGVTGSRNPAPTRRNVGCHHMNYFLSEPGQKALLAVEWERR